MNTYYFFGEFGYLHQVILAYIQRFVIQNPDKKNKINLIVFVGVDEILETLFPNFFTYTTVPIHPSRGGFHSELDKQYPQAQHISRMFSEQLPHWLGDIPYRSRNLSRYYLLSPIPCAENTELDLFRKNFKQTIVCFFRKRDMEARRNYEEKENDWTNILRQQFSDPNTLCCIYSYHDDECLTPSYVDRSASNVFFIRTIKDAIYFFHTCDVFYTNDSGLTDFAKNCNTKKVVICPDPNNTVFIAAPFYNPFQTEVELFGKDVELIC